MVIGTRLSPSTATSKGPRTVVAFGRGQTAANAVAAKKAAAERAKAPPVPRSSNAMRRSGSLGHLVTSTSAIHHQAYANANSNGQQRTVCKCTESPEGMAFLEGVYVQNLQTQIEVLELENAYLRGSTERGALFTRHSDRRFAPALASSSSRRRRTSTTAEAERKAHQTRNGAIGTESEEEEDGGEGGGKAEEKRRRQRHPSSLVNAMPKRRVAFRTDHPSTSKSPHPRRHDAESSSSVDYDEEAASVDEPSDEMEEYIDSRRDNGRRKKKSESGGNRYDDNGTPPGADSGVPHAALADERQRRHAAEQQLRAAQLRADEAEQQLRETEERAYGEKRTLLADSAELQRRLDELTPKLAEQEAKMMASEAQRDEANARLRAALKQMNALQTNLADRTRESRQLESDRERNVQRLQRQVDELGRALDTIRAREETMNMELDRAKARLIEEEQRNQQELLEQQRTEREERSKLETKLMEAQQNSELANAELELARERLAKEQEAVRALGTKLKERQLEDEQRGSARLRVQRELEAVQSLSHSLANENKGLREERGAQEEKLNELRQRLHSKDTRVQRMAELLGEFLEKYRQSAQRAQHQIGKQTEDWEQFEQIVEKMRQTAGSAAASSSSPPHASATGTTTTTTGASTRRTGGSTRRSKMD